MTIKQWNALNEDLPNLIVGIPDEEFEWLQAQAREVGCSPTEVVRQAILNSKADPLFPVTLANAAAIITAPNPIVSAIRFTRACRQIIDLWGAHEALSSTLNDNDAGNDEVRDAALAVCEALDALHTSKNLLQRKGVEHGPTDESRG